MRVTVVVPGAYGIAHSYEKAREGLSMAARMHLDRPVVETRDLTCRVLARDQPALVDLVYYVLHPLRQARGGAGPLVETLVAYFDSGCVALMAAPGCTSRCGPWRAASTGSRL